MKAYLLTILTFLIFQFAFSQVVINEINYRSTEFQQETEFIELHNFSNSIVDLSNWILDDGITFQFANGTFLNANDYLIVAKNVNDFNNVFNVLTNVYGPFTGKLSNLEDNIILRNANFDLVDEVNYQSWNEWNNVRYLDADSTKTSISLQKINPNLNGDLPGSWKAALPTPQNQNTSVFENVTNELPIVNRVSKTPNKPNSNDTVKIEVELEQLENLSANNFVNVFLEYQIVQAGNYIAKLDNNFNSGWINVTMFDDGTNGDANANNGVYTFQFLPAFQNHRNLVRYRIVIETSFGFQQILPDQNHNENNYAFYVYDDFPNVNGLDVNALNPIQSIQILTKNSDVNDYIFNYDENEYPGQGTLIYDGEVYDHINFRARGKDSRHARAKRNLKFALNKEKPVYTLNDYGKTYNEPETKISLSGTYINDSNSHGLTESIIYKIFELTGAVAKSADYCQVRIVDNAIENGTNGDFWGLYLILDNYDKNFLSERNLPDANIYAYKPFELAHEGEVGPIGLENPVYNNWNLNMGNSQNNSSNNGAATASQFYYNNNLNLDNHFGFIVGNEVIANAETNYAGQHQYKEYYNPTLQKWSIFSGDYDQTFGMPQLGLVTYNRSQSDPLIYVQGPIKNQLLSYSIFEEAYKNEIRSSLDLLFNEEQINYLVDNEVSTVYNNSLSYNWIDADKFIYNQTYNNFETEVIDWYKNFFALRAGNLYSFWADNDKPNTPTITYTGTTNFAINDLTFSSADFADSQGQNTFAAMQWRIGEWSDPSNNVYDDEAAIYEIEELYTSPEIIFFNDNFVFDGTNLKPNHTYKVRVRHKDNTNKWSKWSSAISFVAQAAINPIVPNLIISEINYNPSDECGSEYIEIYNNSNQAINLANVRFTKGMEYDFPQNSSLAANQYLVLAEDSLAFLIKYGYAAFGDYSKSLSNSGEKIVLKGAYNVVIDSVEYEDDFPWNSDADGAGFSLSLIDNNFDNNLATSWYASNQNCGTPGFENNICTAMQNSLSSTNPTCYNYNDGIVFSNVSGGVFPYTYNWSNGEITGLIFDLPADTYFLEVTDALGCILNDTAILQNPLQIDDNELITEESFFNTNDASIVLNPINAIVPYTFLWNNGEVNNDIYDLLPGNYSVEIVDNNNCSAQFQYTILPFACNGLSLNLTIENETLLDAANGSASVNLVGGISPFSILWSNAITDSTTIFNLAPGNYFVEVTDASNCTTTQNFVIEELICDSIIINSNVQNETCFNYQNGSIEINLTEGTVPFNFEWTVNGFLISENSNLMDSLPTGNYAVIITDSTNCVVNDSFVIEGSTSLLQHNSIVTEATGFGTNDGSIQIETNGGTLPYNFNWSNGTSIQSLNNINFGSYNLEITDSFACTLNQTFNIDAAPNSCGVAFTNELNLITINGFEIIITAANNATNYELHYRNVDSLLWEVATFSDTILNLTDLQICSTYEYKIRTDCNNSLNSDFTFSEFVTTSCDVNCIADLLISVDSITTNEAIFSWNEAVQFSYNLYYKAEESQEFEIINNISSPFNLDYLYACSTYNYYLESICAIDSITQYASISNFTTACLSNVLNVEQQNEILIYPNPSNNFVNIKSSHNLKSIVIYNQFGATIKKLNSLNSQLINLNVSEFAVGNYYLNLETEQGKFYNQSFIKN